MLDKRTKRKSILKLGTSRQQRKDDYRILRNKRFPPTISDPSLFEIENYIELKGKSEVFEKKIYAKQQEKVGLFQFGFQQRPQR